MVCFFVFKAFCDLEVYEYKYSFYLSLIFELCIGNGVASVFNRLLNLSWNDDVSVSVVLIIDVYPEVMHRNLDSVQ